MSILLFWITIYFFISRSAFFFFCKDERPKSIKENPSLKPSEVATMLGQKWKTISADIKGIYEKKAAKDKLRYKKVKISQHL